MATLLSSPVRLVGRLLLWGSVKEGNLTLSDGTLTLTRLGDVVFSVPVGEVKVRVPKLYFGMGMKLSVQGNGSWPRSTMSQASTPKETSSSRSSTPVTSVPLATLFGPGTPPFRHEFVKSSPQTTAAIRALEAAGRDAAPDLSIAQPELT